MDKEANDIFQAMTDDHRKQMEQEMRERAREVAKGAGLEERIVDEIQFIFGKHEK